MKRYLSVWLPRWPIERRFARPVGDLAHKPSPDDPLALSTMAESGAQLTATNAAAEALGLSPGMSLTDARAVHPALEVIPADFEGDAAALLKLTGWARAYSPLVSVEPPDGFTIDATGCAHLFGGEAGLVKGLAARLERFGLTARLAIAPSIGAAWALAHYGRAAAIIASPETLRDDLKALPVAALRIGADVQTALRKVGLKRIGDLLGKPHGPLAIRFGRALILRLGQALGEESEAFHALHPPPLYRTVQRFAEPVVSLQDIEHVVCHLAVDLAHALSEAGKGARHLELVLFRVDGWHETLHVHTSANSQNADHFIRLFKERLDRIKGHMGFGFELMALSAFETERASITQQVMEGEEDPARDRAIAPLLDRFANRFGSRNVTRFAPRASYIPERAVESASVMGDRASADWAAHARALHDDTPSARPLLLFINPEPITVLVEMPDHPPERFEWRRISHRIARAEGPERLGPEWWRQGSKAPRTTRDYYRVEDEAGHRFWLYREGLYDRAGDEPRWFIHGVFP